MGTSGSSLNLRENLAQLLWSCGGGPIACMSSADSVGSGVYDAGMAFFRRAWRGISRSRSPAVLCGLARNWTIAFPRRQPAHA